MSKLICLLMVFGVLLGCVTEGDVKESMESAEDAAQYNLELGAAYIRQGKHELALEKLSRSIEQNPDVPETQTTIALLYEQLGQIEKAEKHYKTALRLDKTDAASLNIYGVFLCRHRGWDRAQRYFDDAVKDPLYRNREAVYTNAGICARKAGELDVAEKYFRSGLSTNPKYPEALLQLADLSYKRESFLASRAFLQRYMDVGPVTPPVLWLGIRIERELGDRDALRAFERRLQSEYPGSVQTRLMLESKRDAG